MTDKPKAAPHPAAAHEHAHAHPPKKPGCTAAPRPPIPSVEFHPDAAPTKGKVAGAVAATVGAIGLIGYGIAGIATKMLRRGR